MKHTILTLLATICLLLPTVAGHAQVPPAQQQVPPRAMTPPQAQPQSRPQLPPGAAGQAPMPAMQPPVLAPSFLEVGRFYRFILVRKELRGEVLEIDRSGWIRVHFHEDDDDIPAVPWLNLYHVTMIVPEGAVEPIND